MTGEFVSFDPLRCAAAAEYLADFVRQEPIVSGEISGFDSRRCANASLYLQQH